MSGGSYNYTYFHIEELALNIRGSSPLRRAFKAHLMKVAKAAKDIEWVDSGDWGLGDEDEAIKECLGSDTQASVLRECVAEAQRVLGELKEALEEAEK